MNKTLPLLLVTLFSSAIFAEALDWPQFRGPNRDGISRDSGLLEKWPDGGPKLAWTATGAGRGYSSVAIENGKLFTLGDGLSTAQDKDEHLVCFDVSDGKQLWSKKVGPAWKGRGPDDWQSSRSTPTLDGSRAYLLTAHGKLLCCSTDDGAVIWSKDLKADFGGDKGDGWGYGESVLVDGDVVVCTPGKEKNTMVALDKKTGELVWNTSRPDDRGAGHASIQISYIDGKKIYVNTTASGAMGVRASDGELQWTYDIDKTTAVIPSPIIREDLVFFTAGYNRGGALLRQVEKDGKITAEEVYPLNNKLENKHGGVVLIGDHIYGDSGDKGMPFCAELMTGNIVWRERGSGKKSAAVTAADGHLYIVFHNSTVVMAKATPEDYEEVGSFDLKDNGYERPMWSHPVVTGGKLFVRQDDKIYCYEIGG